MYEDLEQLAALRFGKELEDISAQTRENIKKQRTASLRHPVGLFAAAITMLSWGR